MNSDSQKQPFLHDYEGGGPELDCQCQVAAPQRQRRYWVISLLIHGLILVSTFSVANLFLKSSVVPSKGSVCAEGYREARIHSPIPQSVLKYEVDWPGLDSWNDHLYMGEPTYEGDDAWNEIMSSETFKITHEDAARLNISLDSAVPLKSGDGYAGILGVMHNLHCLRRIRQSRYPEYYYPDWTPEQLRRDLHHQEHCLEALRQSVMCHPDLTPHPYWHSGIIDHDLSANPGVSRRCINWDSLHEWMLEERTVLRKEIFGAIPLNQ